MLIVTAGVPVPPEPLPPVPPVPPEPLPAGCAGVADTGAELELWSLRKEAAYFREVFGRELLATLA